MTTKVLYVRLDEKLYDALVAVAEQRGSTLARTTSDLLTGALVHMAVPSVLPPEVESILMGRRMFALLSGFLQAAAGEGPEELEAKDG